MSFLSLHSLIVDTTSSNTGEHGGVYGIVIYFYAIFCIVFFDLLSIFIFLFLHQDKLKIKDLKNGSDCYKETLYYQKIPLSFFYNSVKTIIVVLSVRFEGLGFIHYLKKKILFLTLIKNIRLITKKIGI